MTDTWFVILALAACTYAIRLSGVLLGQRLPVSGPWARGLTALPGCLIIALVTHLLVSGGPQEWIAGSLALAVALWTRNLPLTMTMGIVSIFLLRHYA